jgi:hypothetical protein
MSVNIKMVEKERSSLTTSYTSNMDSDQQNEKDVSKVFALLRAKLSAKEKELLELQRAEPCLLAPDCKQIDKLLNAISSLHLSTQEGSFIFASNASSSSSSTSVCSTDVDAIKTLPSTVWLRESIPIKQAEEQKNEYRLPMVTHLLSLPVNAYLASSSNCSAVTPFEAAVQTEAEPSNRLPMVSQLLSMPINAFKSSASIQPTKNIAPVEVEDKKETVNNDNKISLERETPKSILSSETIYSKEHWLKKSSSSESDFVTLDLDEYIEHSTEKMRRLHMEYLAALDKLKTPSNPVDSSQAIKSMYPQMFDRINEEISPPNLTRLHPSKK